MTSGDGLFVVHVQEQRSEALAGHEGREYTSPPRSAHKRCSWSSWCSARRSR